MVAKDWINPLLILTLKQTHHEGLGTHTTFGSCTCLFKRLGVPHTPITIATSLVNELLYVRRDYAIQWIHSQLGGF